MGGETKRDQQVGAQEDKVAGAEKDKAKRAQEGESSVRSLGVSVGFGGWLSEVWRKLRDLAFDIHRRARDTIKEIRLWHNELRQHNTPAFLAVWVLIVCAPLTLILGWCLLSIYRGARYSWTDLTATSL